MKKIIGIFIGILMFCGVFPSFVYAFDIFDSTGKCMTEGGVDEVKQYEKLCKKHKKCKIASSGACLCTGGAAKFFYDEKCKLKLEIIPMATDDYNSCQQKKKSDSSCDWDNILQICTCDTQKVPYTDNPENTKKKKKTEKDKKKADKEATRAKTALEKEYASDVKSLVNAFNTVVNKIVTKCESEGKTIVDGECK